MRIAPCVIMAFCLGVIGCSTFGKKPASTPNSPPRAPAEPRVSLPQEANPVSPPGPAAPAGGVGGILAGQVIDRYNYRPPATSIQVAEAAAPPGGAPIEVPADSQGYFTIQGLQPGRQYQLTARARSGERPLIGTTYAIPPDPRVVIHLSEDVAAPAAPSVGPVPGWPSPQGLQAQGLAPSLPSPNLGEGRVGAADSSATDSAWAPGRTPAPARGNGYLGNPVPNAPRPRAAELGPPLGIPNVPANPRLQPTLPQTPPIQVQPRVEVAPERIVGGDALAQGPPSCDMHGPGGGLVGGASHVPLAAPLPPYTRTRVPSCDLTGRTLYNFALYDLNGQAWEFRQRRGRLVLLDFWGTWCTHCVHAIPHLNDWQQRYGPYGLEVVGIAYEDGSVPRQVEKVKAVRQAKQINYRLLLGSDGDACPVKRQFQITGFPTLVLLDEQGHIIYRMEGLEPAQIRELDIIIRQRLGVH